MGLTTYVVSIDSSRSVCVLWIIQLCLDVVNRGG